MTMSDQDIIIEYRLQPGEDELLVSVDAEQGSYKYSLYEWLNLREGHGILVSRKRGHLTVSWVKPEGG